MTQLYKEFEDCYKKLLSSRSEDFILSLIQQKFADILSKSGFQVQFSDQARVCAIVTDPDIKFLGQTAVVALKMNGEVEDIAMFNTLTLRKLDDLHEADKARYMKERAQFVKLLVDSKPQAVVIGANSLQSVQLRRSIGLLLEAMSVDSYNEAEIGTDLDKADLFEKAPAIVMGDTKIPKLFATSQRSIKMCENHKLLTRIAISLGRYLQNPLAEILGLWNDPNELQIKYLNLHPLESLVSEHKRLSALEIIAVSHCCQSGINLNEIYLKTHLYGLLSFIPGLGPVRAYGIMDGIRYRCNEELTSRSQLLEKKILPSKVYENACGFIKISYQQGRTHPLECTRIHPDQYELSRIISQSALGMTGISDDVLFQDVMKNPLVMQELDLDIYAQIQAEKGLKNMKEVMEFIVAELSLPFWMPKKKYAEPSPEELMFLCTNETKETLRRGSILQVMVVGFDERRECLRCLLECEVEGTIDQRHLVEGRFPTESDLKKFVKGGKLHARVLEVTAKLQSQKDLFLKVKLSILPDDISNHGKFVTLSLDDAFIIDESDWIEKTVMEDEQKTGQKYVPRVINHLKYRNIGMRTACDELSSKEIGEFVFRPSSRGQDHLTCTWKFYDYIYAHLDIIEEGKPSPNMLGIRFRIGTDLYDSLQDVADRYITPCERLVRDAILHPKFKDSTSGSLAHLENIVIQEKRARPTTVPYYFAATSHYPQYFVLIYQKTDLVIKEFIKVKPKGLFFHEAYHPNMNFLISWFKRHCNEPSYLNQLARAVPPKIDTSSSTVAKGDTTTDENINIAQTPAKTPGWGGATPYNQTPHIGAEEWNAGKEGGKTPRADDWETGRNFDSWGEAKKPEVKQVQSAGGWGGDNKPAEGPGGWGGESKPAQSTGGWGGEESKPTETKSGGWGGASSAPTTS